MYPACVCIILILDWDHKPELNLNSTQFQDFHIISSYPVEKKHTPKHCLFRPPLSIPGNIVAGQIRETQNKKKMHTTKRPSYPNYVQQNHQLQFRDIIPKMAVEVTFNFSSVDKMDRFFKNVSGKYLQQ